MKDGKKVVLTYGTYDLFHEGHLNIIRRARELGDILVVGVSTDEFNAVKGKHAYFPYSFRSELVSSLKYVDEVFPEDRWEQHADDIRKYDVDVVVMGSDWTGRFDELKDLGVDVIYLPRTDNISTTRIKNDMKHS